MNYFRDMVAYLVAAGVVLICFWVRYRAVRKNPKR